MLSRRDGVFRRVGKNFSKILCVDFMKESLEYINRINNFMYFGDTMLYRYRLNAVQSFKQRLRSKFNMSNAVPMYFSQPSKEEFITETRRYLIRLFENYAANKKINKIVLDQAIPPTNISKTLKYFPGSKLIIVDRDPRDIYTTMINENLFLGADILDSNSVHKYVAWHRSVRKQTIQDNNTLVQDRVLRLKFEDLFLNYERVIRDIKEFLNIDFNHKEKSSKFNPESMNSHVGIWKNTPHQDIMIYIEKELKEYCFSL
jgi:hypothetical protein